MTAERDMTEQVCAAYFELTGRSIDRASLSAAFLHAGIAPAPVGETGTREQRKAAIARASQQVDAGIKVMRLRPSRVDNPQPGKPAEVFGTCDWGDCDDEAVDYRYSQRHGWLPVCVTHAAPSVGETRPVEPIDTDELDASDAVKSYCGARHQERIGGETRDGEASAQDVVDAMRVVLGTPGHEELEPLKTLVYLLNLAPETVGDRGGELLVRLIENESLRVDVLPASPPPMEGGGAVLEQARRRLEQCRRDCREPDKVFAQATSGLAEITGALTLPPVPAGGEGRGLLTHEVQICDGKHGCGAIIDDHWDEPQICPRSLVHRHDDEPVLMRKTRVRELPAGETGTTAMREALAWYADGTNYERTADALPARVTWDGGDRARRALAAGESAEPGDARQFDDAVRVGTPSYVPLSIREAGGAALEAWRAGASYDEARALIPSTEPGEEARS